MQTCSASPWNEAAQQGSCLQQEGRWPIACRKLQGSWKDARVHLRAITREPTDWFKRSKTIICREFPPAFLSEVITTTKSVCATSLPLPATAIAVKAVSPAVEKPSCREELVPGSHRRLPHCSRQRRASQQKLNNPAQQVKSFSVLLKASLKCRDKTFMHPMDLGFLDPPWHGFWGINEVGVPGNAGGENRSPID